MYLFFYLPLPMPIDATAAAAALSGVLVGSPFAPNNKPNANLINKKVIIKKIMFNWNVKWVLKI